MTRTNTWTWQFRLWHALVGSMFDESLVELIINWVFDFIRWHLACSRPCLQFRNHCSLAFDRVSSVVLLFCDSVIFHEARAIVGDDFVVAGPYHWFILRHWVHPWISSSLNQLEFVLDLVKFSRCRPETRRTNFAWLIVVATINRFLEIEEVSAFVCPNRHRNWLCFVKLFNLSFLAFGSDETSWWAALMTRD